MTDKTLQERLRLLAYAYDLPDCTEAADALDAQEARIKALEGALRTMYESEKDYIIRNNLGDPHHNQRMKVARALVGEK